MSLDIPALVASAVSTVFEVTDSLDVPGTLSTLAPGSSYNPTTGSVTTTTTNTAVNVRFGLFDRKEIDGESIRSGDRKIFIKRSQLATVPKMDDYFTETTSGKRWDVRGVTEEPTGSLVIIHARTRETA